MSWESTLDTMLDTAEAVREDVRQLRGALNALVGVIVPAFTAEDLGGGWPDRDDIG
jgi:hypothetical protein